MGYHFHFKVRDFNKDTIRNGRSQLIFLDYIINLSIFSLLVSTPLVIRSLINHNPLKHIRLWVGVYAGIVSSILVALSVQQGGYAYDIRYAAVILAFAYLGPAAGIITGSFALIARLLVSDHWYPAIIGWVDDPNCFHIITNIHIASHTSKKMHHSIWFIHINLCYYCTNHFQCICG